MLLINKLTIMKTILLFIWQILQNIVGLCYWFISQAIIKEKRNDVYILETDSRQGSVSLGNFVFISKYTRDKEFTTKHELGHTIQSKYLGPLYLLVVGIPSIMWVGLRRMVPILRKRYDYYDVFPENWANKLSGLK